MDENELLEENVEICKWCERCMITDEKNGWGCCDLDIGCHVQLSDKACDFYRYDDDLSRS